MQDGDAARTLRVTPVAFVRSAFGEKVDAPRQPVVAADHDAVLEFCPGKNFEHALEDLQDWERLWVIFWFDRNAGWRPKVLPPRSTTGRKGVFATRSPHRPNPLGLSAVSLVRVDGLRVYIRGNDLLDGTPVLDVKPYVPYTDAFPDAGSGWLEREAQRAAGTDPVAAYAVSFTPEAEARLAWIVAQGGPALRDRIVATLSLGPQPHPYRRIRREAGGSLRLALRDWRVAFDVTGRDVRVTDITTGYKQSQIAAAATASAEDPRRLHQRFLQLWPRRDTP